MHVGPIESLLSKGNSNTTEMEIKFKRGKKQGKQQVKIRIPFLLLLVSIFFFTCLYMGNCMSLKKEIVLK